MACPQHDDFKISPNLLCSHKSRKYDNYDYLHKKVSQDLTEKKQDLTEMSIILMVLTKI